MKLVVYSLAILWLAEVISGDGSLVENVVGFTFLILSILALVLYSVGLPWLRRDAVRDCANAGDGTIPHGRDAEIKSPRATRILIAFLLLAGIAFFAWRYLIGSDYSPIYVTAFSLSIVPLVLGLIRVWTVSLRIEQDGVVYRGVFRTVRVPRNKVHAISMLNFDPEDSLVVDWFNATPELLLINGDARWMVGMNPGHRNSLRFVDYVAEVLGVPPYMKHTCVKDGPLKSVSRGRTR